MRTRLFINNNTESNSFVKTVTVVYGSLINMGVTPEPKARVG